MEGMNFQRFLSPAYLVSLLLLLLGGILLTLGAAVLGWILLVLGLALNVLNAMARSNPEEFRKLDR